MDKDAVLWPLIVYSLIVAILVVGMITVSYVLGQRHHEPATDLPYESGMLPTGSARLRYPANFYLVAMFFVIMDLESAFVVAWAIAARQVGWAGYSVAALFIGVLAVTLAYLWRVGALDSGPSGRKQRDNPPPLPEERHADVR